MFVAVIWSAGFKYMAENILPSVFKNTRKYSGKFMASLKALILQYLAIFLSGICSKYSEERRHIEWLRMN